MKKRASVFLRGYPIPYARQKRVQWVNSTPHLSFEAAHDHAQWVGKFTYSEFLDDLAAVVSPLLTDWHLSFFNEMLDLARKDYARLRDSFFAIILAPQERAIEYQLDKLLEDKAGVQSDPLFADHVDEITTRLLDWTASLPDTPLNRYERKLALKYAAEASSRTGQGYMAQIEKYLPTRPEFTHIPMPDMAVYEESLKLHYSRFGLSHMTRDGVRREESLFGYLARARKTTFGGYPYLANMSDFVSKDVNDPTTYADLYNRLAIMFYFLKPADKVRAGRVLATFIALERVQPGGVEVITDDEHNEVTYKKKPNKQRFVQAQSAVLSHCYKLFVDQTTALLRKTQPQFVADKFSEEAVTVHMKNTVARGASKQIISPETSLDQNCIGTDYDNFDAHQDICMSNDTHYQIWRMQFPASFTEYLIDPYVQCVYREGSILVPGHGYIHTTGVRSGMVDTNQCDTLNCSMADIYELKSYQREHPEFEDSDLQVCLSSASANGDDRFKLSPCSAADIERFDWELGFICQKSKTEILPAHTPLTSLGVTFLKTIICLDPRNDHALLRTDAISKIILAKLNPERVRNALPYSMVVDFFMSTSRSTESPYLYILVDFMYRYLPVFADLVDGRLQPDQLIAGMVREQMEVLRAKRGKEWMARKGMDYDGIMEQMNIKYGYGDEGYRAQTEALNSDRPAAGIMALPSVQAIMAEAYSRKSAGTLGSFWMNQD